MIPFDSNYRPDAQAALARARQIYSYTTGMCLEFVYRVVLGMDRNSNNSGHYTDARRAREATPEIYRHYERTPPPGAIVYFYNGSNRDGLPGHVAISTGNGNIRSTDWPRRGVVGETSISTLESSWNRPFAFWTDWLCGYYLGNIDLSILNATPAQDAPAGAPPIADSVSRWFALNWRGFLRMLKARKYYPGSLSINSHVLGEEVKAWQRYLNDDGIAQKQLGHPLKVDGWAGRETLAVTQAYLGRDWGYTGGVDLNWGKGCDAAWLRAESGLYNWRPWMQIN